MSGWKRKGFWTNHGWDMIFSHKKLRCCLIGHLHICNFDFRTPIFILYEMYRKLKMLEYKHLLKSPIFPFDSRLWKGQFGNGKGMEKIHSRNSGTGREWKKSIPKIREREGNEKNPFPKFGNGKGMKKSIPKVRERESEASILGNDREREFPLTPDTQVFFLQTF